MKINQNTNFGTHNTSKRTGAIEYIVLHYVGATGDAKNNVNYYNQRTTTSTSADFFVGHSGDIWQYNPDPKSRYCWAVGGGKQSSYGGSLYGKAKNANSVSIEMCVKTKGSQAANSPDWYCGRRRSFRPFRTVKCRRSKRTGRPIRKSRNSSKTTGPGRRSATGPGISTASLTSFSARGSTTTTATTGIKMPIR